MIFQYYYTHVRIISMYVINWENELCVTWILQRDVVDFSLCFQVKIELVNLMTSADLNCATYYVLHSASIFSKFLWNVCIYKYFQAMEEIWTKD